MALHSRDTCCLIFEIVGLFFFLKEACSAQGKGWLGVYQHIPVKNAAPADELLATFWVAAQGLTEGAGVYVDVSYSAVSAKVPICGHMCVCVCVYVYIHMYTHTHTIHTYAQQHEAAWSGDSGIRIEGTRGGDGGGGKAWKSGRWGERPAVFVKVSLLTKLNYHY